MCEKGALPAEGEGNVEEQLSCLDINEQLTVLKAKKIPQAEWEE